MANPVTRWLGNARAGATVQSVMPAVLTYVLALGTPGMNHWLAWTAIVGVWLAHLSMNLADDYFDYKADMLKDKEKVVRRGIKAYTAKYPFMTDGSTTEGQLLAATLVFAGLALCCGLAVALVQGWQILWIAAAAGFLGVFYSAPPIRFCYWGMGEIVTGVIFGPLLMEGIWWAATGAPSWSLLFVSVPVGLLVVNILFTHSFLDRSADEESDKKTLAHVLRTNGANLAMSTLINVIPFACIVAGVAMGYLHWAYLAVLLVMPRAMWLLWSLFEFAKGHDIERELANPRKWLGNLGDWKAVREAHLDWFLIRWLTARNTVSGYCLMVIIVKLILLIA